MAVIVKFQKKHVFLQNEFQNDKIGFVRCHNCAYSQCSENRKYTRILARFNHFLEEIELTRMEDCWLSGSEQVCE